MHRFRGTVVVVKYGGAAMKEPLFRARIARDVATLCAKGIRPVMVHGGGPQINTMLSRLNVESTFVGGFRVTTPEIMEIVQMVLLGQVQPQIIKDLASAGVVAQSLSGHDGELFVSIPKNPALGLVGNIAHVSPDVVTRVLDAGIVPVVASCAPDEHGQFHNVNADSAASALAIVLGASKLIVLTDVNGFYRRWPDEDSRVDRLTVRELENLLPDFEGGMVPKMAACAEVVRAGVSEAHIVNGQMNHVLCELFTQSGIGTTVVA